MFTKNINDVTFNMIMAKCTGFINSKKTSSTHSSTRCFRFCYFSLSGSIGALALSGNIWIRVCVCSGKPHNLMKPIAAS